MTAQPRIGYVVKRYPRYSETFIVNELLAHQAAGLEVEIFSLRPPNDTHFQDAISRVRYPVHYLPYAGLKGRVFWEDLGRARELPHHAEGLELSWGRDQIEVHQAVQLASMATSLGLDHLHAHFASSPAAVTRLAARFAGLTFSVTAHAKDIFHEEVEPNELTERALDADTLVTVSDYNVRHLRADVALAGAEIQRIYNGLDLDTFGFESARDRSPTILAVGRLVEKKGFGDLVAACGVLSEQGHQFRCRIVGVGPLEADLAEQIGRLGLGGCVELVGPLPQARIREEIRAAAAFAAPCVVGLDGNRDGLPTTLLESMALGTPCVSTDVTGIPEVIVHDRTGLAVPQNDPKALAAALARLLADASLRDRLAREARTLVEAQFDIAKQSALLREVFRAAIARRHDQKETAA